MEITRRVAVTGSYAESHMLLSSRETISSHSTCRSLQATLEYL